MKVITAVFIIEHGEEGDDISAEHLAYNVREGYLTTGGYAEDPGSRLFIHCSTVAIVSVDADGTVETCS